MLFEHNISSLKLIVEILSTAYKKKRQTIVESHFMLTVATNA